MIAILLKALCSGRALAGLAGSLLLSICIIQSARLGHAKTDLAQVRAQLVDPETHLPWRSIAVQRGLNIEGLVAAASRQQAAVEALKAASDEATQSAEQALAQAHRFSGVARREADAVMAAKPSGDLCAAADALIVRSTEQEARP